MRFYVSSDAIFLEKGLIDIRDREEIHHICRVMRLRQGMDVEVFDGKGSAYSGIIGEISKDSVIIRIKAKSDFRQDSLCRVTLYQAIPKKTRMDFIVEKAVELGVDSIIPIITERTVARVSGPEKVERWKRLAVTASKQSGRVRLPGIACVTDFKAALKEARKHELSILAALDKSAMPLKAILRDCRAQDIAVFIGPEGDFSESEIQMSMAAGCRICSLGSLVLRVETAVINILSCINYEYSR